ncbi:Acyl transferase [Kitasatospora sp. MMS16-BH015]|uniref:acyltransferase domain-containing protein n=1 Tax=Kitasatospora sp. MMS16-BH015 TaxID=2018025 RepID=UPI000CA33EBE|nr:acyltransferase domain-containing protein [Kitasatospora sp. MMS16-BH015]AUG75084.1 Acyl transferase [Kitasatospora sp. MMS16-BH015]
MTSTVHLFPGLGDFSVSPLLAALPRAPGLRSAVAEVFAEADPAGREFGLIPLGRRLIGRAPPSSRELAAEVVGTVQLAQFGVSLAVHRALVRAGLAADALVAVSFGEIPALVAAGSLSVSDGARLACRLGQLLHSAEGGLTLIRFSPQQAEALLLSVGHPEVVLACINHPGEVVLSGPLRPLEEVERAAHLAGWPPQRIRLPFLAHHPWLHSQGAAFTAFARTLRLAAPRLPIHSAVAGTVHTARTDLPRALGRCLTDLADFPTALHQAVASTTAAPPVTPSSTVTPSSMNPPDSPPTILEAGTGQALTMSARHLLPTVSSRSPLADPAFSWPPGPTATVGPTAGRSPAVGPARRSASSPARASAPGATVAPRSAPTATPRSVPAVAPTSAAPTSAVFGPALTAVSRPDATAGSETDPVRRL